MRPLSPCPLRVMQNVAFAVQTRRDAHAFLPIRTGSPDNPGERLSLGSECTLSVHSIRKADESELGSEDFYCFFS